MISPHDDYGKFRAALLVRIFAGKPTPRQVGDYLATKRAKYPQIREAEIERYRLWGEKWPCGNPLPSHTTLAQSEAWEPAQEWPEPGPLLTP